MDIHPPVPHESACAPVAAALPPAGVAPPASFAGLGLSSRVLANVRAAGYERPTPIQAQFIPKALLGRDVMGQAKTGTGKTAAFLLPLFERLQPGEGNPAVLILAPTRELALQIHGEIQRLGTGLGFRSVILYGGSSYEPQIAGLAAGVDIVVGTPGRLMDHMRARRLSLSSVRAAVLDEADRMLDLGFRKDIEYILRHCPSQRQTMILSATIPDDILKLAKRFMHDPEEIWTAPENLTVDQVEQYYVVAERDEKFQLLLKVLDEERPSLAIIFCGTKFLAKKLAAKLKNVHLNAREIHGDLVQAKREKIMGHFRKGRVQLLVATDVASRGIDVDNITHIINYDVPYRAEDYVHRIGRTGRMDKCGKAFTFVGKDEAEILTSIELLINKEIKRRTYPDLTSIFWPNLVAVLPPEFRGDDTESAMTESDYLAPAEPKGGPGRRGSRGRDGGRDGGRARTDRTRSGPSSSGGRRGPAAERAPDAPALAPSEARGRGRSRGGRQRDPVAIVCAACGASATVRFKPDPGRPVYCDACYQKAKGAAPEAGAADPKE